MMRWDVFTLENQRVLPHAAPTDSAEQAVVSRFSGAIEDSFLPEIIKLGKDHQIPWIFISTQERPRPDNSINLSAPVVEYAHALKEYIESNGFQYHDFNADPELPYAVYLDEGHIAHPYKKQYTELFVKRLAGIFK